VATTRGGKYRDTPTDSQVPHLKTVFSFLGLTDVAFVYAEGLNLGAEAEEAGINSAYQQIEEAVRPLAHAKAHVETAELALA